MSNPCGCFLIGCANCGLDGFAPVTPPRPHINAEGKFQSDRYPGCPAGKVPLSITDRTAMDLLWEYAQRRRVVDSEFSEDLETCLQRAGFVAPAKHQSAAVDPQPAAQQLASSTPVSQKQRDRAKLTEATDRIITLERVLSDANARIETLQSDVAARQIRETDLATRLLKSERALRESIRENEAAAERISELRKRGQ